MVCQDAVRAPRGTHSYRQFDWWEKWRFFETFDIDAVLLELARAESRDQGKTITQASKIEIPRAAYNFRYFAQKILFLEDKKNGNILRI